MSLSKQIQIWVALLLLATLVTVFKLNLDSTRSLAAVQFTQSTQNIADLLALLVESHLADQRQLESNITGLFNGGDFERITLRHLDGAVVYQMKADDDANNVSNAVPAFFKRYAAIDPPPVESQVFGNGARYGTIEVKLHPGTFYASLWSSFKKLCLLFLLLSAAAIGGSFLGLNILLKALRRIQHQAEAASNNEYIIATDIPKTPELRKVVIAINTMVAKVQDIYKRQLKDIKYFQELQFQDPVTGLHNRNFLLKRLNLFLDSDTEKAYGQFFILAIVGMEVNNISLGHPAIQKFYQAAADILKGTADPINDAAVARLSEHEFGIVLPDCSAEKAAVMAQNTISAITALIAEKKEFAGLVTIHGGLASYSYKDDAGSLLSKADYALSSAKNNPSGSVEIFQNVDDQTVLGKYQWQTKLHSALSNQRFRLLCQKVMSDREELHREIYINFADADGSVYKAGYFMPMAISLGLASRIDKYVLERAAAHLKRTPARTLAVNITTAFCKDRMAVVWLRNFLEANPAVKGRLFFEIHDNTLMHAPEVCFDMAGLLRQLGFGFGLDQFSLNEASLNQLKELKPDYIKIEKEYFQDIETHGDIEVALNALLTITESLDIKLIVTKIEDDALHKALQSKRIKYFQGFAVAAITPLETA